MGCEGVD